MDDNLLSVLKFGLKQADKATNPPYFKIIGSSEGEAILEPFVGSLTPVLLNGGINNKESKLIILDAPSRIDIMLYYFVSIQNIAYEIILRNGPSSSIQAGLEFIAKNSIGNIVENPTEIKAKIDKLAQKAAREN